MMLSGLREVGRLLIVKLFVNIIDKVFLTTSISHL
jgi:hypothetical protein